METTSSYKDYTIDTTWKVYVSIMIPVALYTVKKEKNSTMNIYEKFNFG